MKREPTPDQIAAAKQIRAHIEEFYHLWVSDLRNEFAATLILQGNDAPTIKRAWQEFDDMIARMIDELCPIPRPRGRPKRAAAMLNDMLARRTRRGAGRPRKLTDDDYQSTREMISRLQGEALAVGKTLSERGALIEFAAKLWPGMRPSQRRNIAKRDVRNIQVWLRREERRHRNK